VSCLAFTIPLRPQAPVDRVPDFSLPDTSGRTVALRQFQGKVILLDFWATWCGPCKKEMPGYEDLYRRYRSRGLVVVGIALDSSPAQVRRFAKKYGITYPLLINGMNVDRYNVLGIPATILADRTGIVRKKVVGFEEGNVFEDVLKELLVPPNKVVP
jgi:peroxiredoxin